MRLSPRGRLAAAALGICSLLLWAPQPATGQLVVGDIHTRRPFVGPDGAPIPAAPTDIREFLKSADVVHTERLGSGSTNPMRCVLEQDGVRLRAIFRDVEINRERVELRDGSEFVEFFDRAIHEVAAYEVALALGIGEMIPPVVERRVDHTAGTLQLWVEDAMTETERIRGGYRPPDRLRWQHARVDMTVFDALIGNSDRNTGNSLIDARWNLWMIDHTRGFQRPRGTPDFADLNLVTGHLLDAIRGLDTDRLRAALNSYLEGPQITSMIDRRLRLIAHFEALIAERGEGAVILR